MNEIITTEVEQYLKSSSSIYKDLNNEIQIFCPYCGDAYRKNNPKWGHLYISKENGLFYCHRCGEKGNLYKLLIDLDFDNKQILNDLRLYYQISSSKKIIQNDKTTYHNITSSEILDNALNNYDTYMYLYKRIGITIDDLIKYNINIGKDYIDFYNGNILKVRRYIKGKIRYKVYSGEYYILKHNNHINNYVISEGAIDSIVIDKYLSYTDYNNYAMLGKKYFKILKQLNAQNAEKIIIFVDNDIDINIMMRALSKRYSNMNIQLKEPKTVKDIAESLL